MNGVGDMIEPQDREAELYAHMERTVKETSDDFKRFLSHILAKSSPIDMDMLSDFLSKVRAGEIGKADLSKALEMAYLEGFRAGQKVTEMINSFPDTTVDEE